MADAGDLKSPGLKRAVRVQVPPPVPCLVVRRRSLPTAILFFSILHSGPSAATKPCPPDPCRSPSGSVDAGKCRELAAWVAVGEIVDVVHHEAGPPLQKDFAEFTLRISSWEKAADSRPVVLRFRVGWCDNAQEIPKDHAGKFRFYGLPLPLDPSLPHQYLAFEPLAVPPKTEGR